MEFSRFYLPLAAILGLIFGSFFNVVIYRFQAGESIVQPPSHCPSCRTNLKTWDLVPVFSYLFLRGRCRYCGASISPRYAVVELFTALIFTAVLYFFGLSWLSLKYALLFSLLLIISAIDLESKRIPNLFVLLIFAWSLFWQLVYPEQSILSAFIGLLAGGGVFLLIALVSRGGMGEGDIKLMGALGFAAGWPYVCMVFLVAFITGAVTGGILVLLKKQTRKSPIPFGPFIAASFFIVATWGEQLWHFYISML